MDIFERGTEIKIGGESYTLVLTTRAARDISAKFGGLEKLGDRLIKGKNMDEALGDLVWVITLLANQGVAIHNLTTPDAKRTPVTEEAVELLTTPADIAGLREALITAISKGTKRNIESEDDEKNVPAVG